MRLSGIRHTIALLLLGVMVFWNTPRTVLHECAKQGAHHEREHDRSLEADEHCSICELTVPPMVDDAQVLRSALCTVLRAEATDRLASCADGALVERAARGPPAVV